MTETQIPDVIAARASRLAKALAGPRPENRSAIRVAELRRKIPGKSRGFGNRKQGHKMANFNRNRG